MCLLGGDGTGPERHPGGVGAGPQGRVTTTPGCDPRSTRDSDSEQRSGGVSSLQAFRPQWRVCLRIAVEAAAGCCVPWRLPGRCPVSPAPARCGDGPTARWLSPSPIPAPPVPPRSGAPMPGTSGHRAQCHPAAAVAIATLSSAPLRSASGSAAAGCRSSGCTTVYAAVPPGSRAFECWRPSDGAGHRQAVQPAARWCP